MSLNYLASYLPQDRHQAMAAGRALAEFTSGAALFADISGFTPLTEALVREFGPRKGAEVLATQLNLVYDALIAEVDGYGGSVISFAGDAITCWFDEVAGTAVARATACAFAMQQTIATMAALEVADKNRVSLGIKAAVAAGPGRRFLVGDPVIQVLDVLAGETLTRMAAIEHLTHTGEVALDRQAIATLGPAVEISTWRGNPKTRDRAAVVRALSGEPAVVRRLAAADRPLAEESSGTFLWTASQLRPWLVPAVYERVQAGLGEFLTELRPAVALFMRFPGWDYDRDGQAGVNLDRYIRWVQLEVSRYEGTLLQLTVGDKGNYLYAAWGAPVAHEDDDRRAVTAALALRAPPPDLIPSGAVQIGISQGIMRTGPYGGTTRRTYGVLGDQVNLAARLMAQAAPGQVLVSGSVQTVVDRHFIWQALPAVQVKGKRHLIAPWAALGPSRADTRGRHAPSYRLPLVGRDAELTLIGEKLDLVLSGQGQIVGITAEAGLGKSRLVAEGIRLAQERGLGVYSGACQAYGTNSPYLVWHSIWRAFFGLDIEAPREGQHASVARALRALDSGLLPRLPLLGAALDLPLPDNNLTRSFDGAMQRASREALLVDIFSARARQHPLLLVLEDCHWLDELSSDLLEALGRVLDQLPVLVLLTYRPAEQATANMQRVMNLSHATEMPLRPLSPEEAENLINVQLATNAALGWISRPAEPAAEPEHRGDDRAALLENRGAAFGENLKARIIDRAQGNPFYLEELLNYLHDWSFDSSDPLRLATLELPNSLHSLILSRLDQLSERQKSVVKVASIIGRRFPLAWLLGYYPRLGEAQHVKADLERLHRLDVTLLDQPEPALAYLFKHIITQEVAYESLPSATRATLHEALAHFLETEGQRTGERPLNLLAYHYERSENRGKQREYLQLAGEAAQAVYANDAAHDYYERLLPLLDDPTEQARIWLALGAVLEASGQWGAAEAYTDKVLALVEGEEWRAAPWARLAAVQARRQLGGLLRKRGQFDAAVAWLEQAHQQAQRLEARIETLTALSQVLGELGRTRWWQSQYPQARTALLAALALARRLNDQRLVAENLFELGQVDWRLGHIQATQTHFEESLALRRQLGDKPGLATCLYGMAKVARAQGNLQTAQALYDESLAIHRQIGDRAGTANCLANLGLVAQAQGDYPAARSLYEESLVLRRQLGDSQGISSCLANLGSLAAKQGDSPIARRLYEESLALKRQIGDQLGIAICLMYLGTVAQAQSDYSPAQALYEESLRRLRHLGDKPGLIWCLTCLGDVALAQYDLPLARDAYIESLALAQLLESVADISDNLVGLAAVASERLCSQSAAFRAVCLAAAAHAQMAAIGRQVDTREQPLYPHILATARAVLDEANFQTAWNEGQALTRDQAIALAVEAL